MEKYTQIILEQNQTLNETIDLLKKIKKLIKAIDKLTAGNQPVHILLEVMNEDITRLLEE